MINPTQRSSAQQVPDNREVFVAVEGEHEVGQPHLFQHRGGVYGILSTQAQDSIYLGPDSEPKPGIRVNFKPESMPGGPTYLNGAFITEDGFFASVSRTDGREIFMLPYKLEGSDVQLLANAISITTGLDIRADDPKGAVEALKALGTWVNPDFQSGDDSSFE
jgi:hypothetical protein